MGSKIENINLNSDQKLGPHLSVDQNQKLKNEIVDEKKYSLEEKKLLELGKNSGNKFNIFKQKEINDNQYKIRESILKKELKDSDRQVLLLMLKKIKDFILGPIIIDSFDKDHASRRDWEKENLSQEKSEAMLNYYHSNKLARNNFVIAYYLIDYLLYFGLVKDQVKQKLLDVAQELEGINKDYDQLEIERKLKAIEDISTLSVKLLKEVGELD